MTHPAREFSFIPGPPLYIQKEKVLGESGPIIAFLGKKALIVCDSFIKETFLPELETSFKSSFIISALIF